MMSLDALERAEQAEGFGRIRHGETSGEAMLSLENLSVSLDDGTAVVDETEDIIEPGERLLVAGEPAASTFIDRRLFMLPQRPYVPSGTLRRAVAYPGSADSWDDEEIGTALHKVGLDHLKEKSRKMRRGIKRCLAARSSVSRLRDCCFTTRISSSWTKPPPRSTRRARTECGNADEGITQGNDCQRGPSR